MEWLGWLKEIQAVDPKLFPPTLLMGLGVYLLLLKRLKAVEARVAQVEATTATIAGIHQRLDDFFDLVQGLLGMPREARPSSVFPGTVADELRLRELAKATLENQRGR